MFARSSTTLIGMTLAEPLTAFSLACTSHVNNLLTITSVFTHYPHSVTAAYHIRYHITSINYDFTARTLRIMLGPFWTQAYAVAAP